MADQTIRITNLPDSGSPERVAYDLFMYLKALRPETTTDKERIDATLDLYAQCLRATKGERVTEAPKGLAAFYGDD